MIQFSMDLKTRKLAFIQEFLKIQNEELISGLENLLRTNKNLLFQESLKLMSQEELESEVAQALVGYGQGNFIEAESLKEVIKEWQ